MTWYQKIACTLYKAFVKLMENAMSKKFLVFITTTVLLTYDHLTPEIWLPVALGVLGVEGVLDFRGGRKNFHHDEPNRDYRSTADIEIP